MTLTQIRNYIVTFGVVVLVLVALNFFTTTTLNNTMEITVDLTSLQEVIQSVGKIEAALEEERIAIGQYALTGNDTVLTRIDAAQVEYDQAWEVIVRNRGVEMAAQIADLEETRKTYKGMLDEVIGEYQSNPANNDSSEKLSSGISYKLQNLDPKFSSLADPEIAKLSERVAVEKERAINLSRYSQGATIMGIVVGLAAVFMTGLAVFGTQRMVNSIAAIVTAANSISRGDLDIPIDVEQKGEIGELAKAIERMRTSLKAAIERLRR